MTIAPRTFGLDVEFPFNPGQPAPAPASPAPERLPYITPDTPVILPWGPVEQPHRAFLSHVANASTAVGNASTMLSGSLVDGTEAAEQQATQGVALMDQALAAGAPEQALHAVRMARGDVINGLNYRGFVPGELLVDHAVAKFNTAASWLAVARDYVPVRMA